MTCQIIGADVQSVYGCTDTDGTCYVVHVCLDAKQQAVTSLQLYFGFPGLDWRYLDSPLPP